MKTELTIQDYGTSILVFIQGETEGDAHGKWLSLYNWNATSTEAEYITDKIISCWSSIEKLKTYFFNVRINQLCKNDNSATKKRKGGFKEEAMRLADEDFKAVKKETFRSKNSLASIESYDIGWSSAEKPDLDFKDSVMTHAFREK